MTEPPERRSEIVSAEDVLPRYVVELEHKRMSLDAGWLGKIFGSASYAPTNIAGFVVCLLALVCVVAFLSHPVIF